MSWFKPKLNISEGKKYDVSEISSDGVTQEEAVKKNKKLIEIFKGFNFNGGEKLEDIELAAAMDAFQKMDSQFGNGDGKLSKSELEKGAAWLNKAFGLEGDKAIDRKDLKEFIKNIEKATRKDEKVPAKGVVENWNIEQKKLKESKAPETTPVVETPQETEEEPPQTEPQKTEQPKPLNNYTVQEGENYTDLITRALKSQGIENPTEEQIKEAKEKFNQNNPDAVHKTKNGTEYLLVGAKVKLEGQLEDKNNASDQINKYNEKHTAPAPSDPPAAANPPANTKNPKPPSAPADEASDKTPDTDAQDAAQKAGYRATDNENYFYDENTKTHYKWDAENKKFIAQKNITHVNKDGSMTLETKNPDGSIRRVRTDKEGYAKTLEARSSDNKNIYTNEAPTAERLGLKTTFHKGTWVDPKTKIHYKWDEESHKFLSLGKDVSMVGKDGTQYNKDGKNGRYQLKKDGTEVYKFNDGYSREYTYDANGNKTKEVSKDKDGAVIESFESTYDAKGNRTKDVYKYDDGTVKGSSEYTYDANGNTTKEVYKDKDGNVTRSYEYTYDANGNKTKEVKKDKDGNVTRSYESTYDANGNETKTVYKDKDGKEISYAEWLEL